MPSPLIWNQFWKGQKVCFPCFYSRTPDSPLGYLWNIDGKDNCDPDYTRRRIGIWRNEDGSLEYVVVHPEHPPNGVATHEIYTPERR